MTIKEQCKQLWREAFSDSEEFIDFYFSRIFSDEINHYVEGAEGRVVAALQAIPFEIKAGDTMFRAAYLSGIATSKRFRRQGFMQRLMDKTHRELEAQCYDMAFLIPAEPYLFDIYAKFGYQTAFYKDYEDIFVNDFPENNVEVKAADKSLDIKELFRYFDRKQRETSGVIFSEKHFSVLTDSFLLEGLPILIATDNGTIAGLAFVGAEGRVPKLFADSEPVRQALLTQVAKLSGRESVMLKTNAKKIPYAMVKPLKNNELILPENLAISLMLDE